MKYEALWSKSAERQLTRLWLGSRFQYALSRAADYIDRELQRNPQDCGESRDEGRRVMFVWPLGVSFKIAESQAQVRVISVWHI